MRSVGCCCSELKKATWLASDSMLFKLWHSLKTLGLEAPTKEENTTHLCFLQNKYYTLRINSLLMDKLNDNGYGKQRLLFPPHNEVTKTKRGGAGLSKAIGLVLERCSAELSPPNSGSTFWAARSPTSTIFRNPHFKSSSINFVFRVLITESSVNK